MRSLPNQESSFQIKEIERSLEGLLSLFLFFFVQHLYSRLPPCTGGLLPWDVVDGGFSNSSTHSENVGSTEDPAVL